MFKKLNEKREKERQRNLIKMAKEHGIDIPPACKDYKQVRFGHNGRHGAVGLGGWHTSLERRAEIARRELEKRGLI